MEFTERELSVIRFALWRFASSARSHANCAAQDKRGDYYTIDAVGAFLMDAADADALLARMPNTQDGETILRSVECSPRT